MEEVNHTRAGPGKCLRCILGQCLHSQQSPPSQPPPRAPQPPPRAPPPRAPPSRAPASEDPESGDMDTDLGSALSADPRGCPLSPLVLIQPKRPPSPGPVKAAGGKRYKGLAGPPSGGLPSK
ncbi:hypothetical protein ElyMa_001684400 [Elysia marginata]|uniref:Uncharacterized protein n=1 Tax=Elysia marginata TaxID=1093978 RepID=A0AAV4JUC1_9GAST|nr:hypothetical protein ElyMa_001684400 [Elysia marginata]